MTRKAQNSAKAAQTTENSYNCLCPAVVIFFYTKFLYRDRGSDQHQNQTLCRKWDISPLKIIS